jgi:hypothetical protein
MGLSTDEVVRRLQPQHLRIPENTGELKEEIQKKVEQPAEEVENPRGAREYTFQFSWKDGLGKIWKGEFTNKILSIRDRQMVGVMRARLATGLPAEALDAFTQEVNLMIAHMSFSLIKTPLWAKDLRDLDDVRLLQALYTEVLDHEATFHGYAKAPEAGAKEG